MFDFISKRSDADRPGKSGDVQVELAALRQMVDAMPVNVMTLDPATFSIDYVNKTSVETLKKLEHLIPCKADQLLGQCIDIFHKNPSHQRRLLADPKNLPNRAQIRLGDEVLDLLVAPIFDAAGSYVNVVRIIPPLVTTDAEVDLALSILDESLAAAGA